MPAPDWPALATVLVPLAVGVQALVWVAYWWALYFMSGALGFLAFNVVAFAVSLAAGLVPADRVVRLARFRNFNRWIGVGIVIAGIAGGEVIFHMLGVMPVVVLELGPLGADFELPMEILKLLAAAGMIAAGTLIGQHSKSLRTAWEASRVLVTPPEHDD